MDLSFLPAWPIPVNNFLLFGAILIVGLIGGQIAFRTGYVPRITGFIAIGLLLGPSGLGLLSRGLLDQAYAFVDVALGLILFQLGLLLDFSRMRHDRTLLLTGMLESAASFGAIFGALYLLGIPPLYAALAAAVGVSSSPAVVLLVVRELGAKGPVTERSLNLVAINNVVAFFAFTALLPFLHWEQQATIAYTVLQPLYRLVGSLVLAYFMAHLTLRMARAIGHQESSQFALMVGVIVLGVGVAKALDLSALLTLLALGIMTKNMDRKRTLMEVEFGHGGEIFFIILFVVAGANLHLHDLAAVGWAALAFVAARIAGKSLAVFVMSRLGGFSNTQSLTLGFTLVPMAGLAIGLVQSTSQMYPSFGDTLAAIVLGAVAILETVGPIATELALKRAGEVAADSKVEH